MPFWLESNQNGLDYRYPFFYFSIKKNKNHNKSILFDYGLKASLSSNSINYIIEEGFFRLNKSIFTLTIGRINERLSNESKLLSSGSLAISDNATPIPSIYLGVKNFSPTFLSKWNLKLKGSLSHGWLNKGQYIEAPFLHQKNLFFKKIIDSSSSINIGIIHLAIWGGETRIHGKQPSQLLDYLRIFFLRPGSKNHLEQEKINTLGNHLGIWDLLYEKEKNDKKLRLYYQHPFEDESGARWLLNRFDGLYGIELISTNYGFMSQFLYEYINTMNQSGSLGATDSTYGWDNYYNHYIYQSGWTYYNKVIGNPLFTRGSNKGSYSDGIYIINNRIKAHHIGLMGNFTKKISYKILFTYSQNFGIFPDMEKFQNEKNIYRFEDGLIQRSTLLQLQMKDINKFNLELSYAIDNGQLLKLSKSVLISINYNYSLNSVSK
tara:strand:- start:309 stop:1610 length:1302 start_codon:yes stop_codon:yes gene_type:complete